ncbi:hypothetical protein [Endozoicomonas ascidiicola]|uniref:hypothetical protein n=1 Tax=Endozoicomonas ascidiicola TaxID=1698521 RepID=UPI000831BB1F|nr:hypothetical protein [Endozoicomonas ascidiicola]
MNMTEMGEVYAYLLRHRIAETRAQGVRRRASQTGLLSERDAAVILKEADEEQMQNFRSFLSGQGLQLGIYDSADYPGIPPGGQIYMLLRNPEAELPAMFSQQQVLQKLKVRNETKEATAVWFIHLWLLMLGLLYTRTNRSLSDVSLYQNAVFNQEELAETLRSHLETIRRTGEDKTESNDAPRQLAILLTEKGEDINRRVKNFTDVLVDANHLQAKGEKIFQQTLLGALEVEQTGFSHLQHLIPGDIGKRIVNLPEPVIDHEETTEELKAPEAADVRH